MKPKVKALLLEALRSGKFKQTTCALREVETVTNKKGEEREVVSFCAVGVLCELHRIHTKGGEWKYGHYVIKGKRKGSGSSIPPEVAQWAGLIESKSKRNGKLTIKYSNDIQWKGKDGIIYSVIDLNDGEMSFGKSKSDKPVSFKKLATLIEKNVPETK